MRFLAIASFALSGVLGLSGALAAGRHSSGTRSARLMPTRSVQPSARPEPAESPLRTPPTCAFSELPALRFRNQNSGQSADVKLYDSLGRIDESEAARLDELLSDTRRENDRATIRLDRRTLQLVVRAALHFHATELQVVSAYRKPGRRREGPHASGRAIDFKLLSVPSRTLASYLRTLPRVGVGIYTHPKTGFVHLDDRAHSFHWLDASPPGRHWREMALAGASLTRLDASYSRASDWPEGTTPPAAALTELPDPE